MNSIVFCLFSFLEKIIRFLPIRITRLLTGVFANIFYYIIPVRKNIAIKNISACFPEMTRKQVLKIVKASYKNLFIIIAEFFYMDELTEAQINEFLKFQNADVFHNIIKDGKGLLIISAHFGNWELNAYGGAKVLKTPFTVIVKQFTNNPVDRRINRIREFGGNRMIEMKNAPKEIMKALRNNEVVAILADQSAPKESQTRVKFFLNDVPVFAGAASFAIKTRTPVIFAASFRNEDYSYTVKFTKIDIDKYKEYNAENIKALTQEHANLLMEAIRKRPDHWLWFHKRFKHTNVKY